MLERTRKCKKLCSVHEGKSWHNATLFFDIFYSVKAFISNFFVYHLITQKNGLGHLLDTSYDVFTVELLFFEVSKIGWPKTNIFWNHLNRSVT